MNIMLNDYCNLKCKYCFAHLNNEKNNISDENMQKFILFLKKSNYKDLRILGGEPTLHPNFIRYIQTANNDRFFQSITIFTNGVSLTPDTIDKIISPKVGFLINLNNKEDIGENIYNKTIENISYLADKMREVSKRSDINLNLGINIYKPDFEYQYIINAAKKMKLVNIRYSITVPTNVGESITLDYYKQYVPRLIQFLQDCYDNGVKGQIDCNNIPKCLFTKEQLITFMIQEQNLCNKNFCGMPMDVRTNLDITRCFPFYDKIHMNLDDFDNIGQINELFFNNIDKFRFEIPTFKECETCELFKNKLCQSGCLTYKFRR